MTDLQAGWYADPAGDVSKLRYWDGTQWTNDVADSGIAPAQPSQSYQVQQPEAPVQPVQPMQPMQSAEVAAQQQFAQQPQAAPQQQYAPQDPQAPQYAPQPVQPAAYGAAAPKPTKGKLLGIIAMALAALALALAFIPILAAGVSIIWVSLILVVVGLVLGIVSIIMARGGKGPKLFTRLGAITSVAALLIIIVWMLVVAVSPQNFLADYQNSYQNDNYSNNNVVVSDPYNNNNSTNNSNNSNTNSNTNTTITVPNTVEVSGNIIGQVGTTYATRWFDFTFNSMYTSNSYEGITAGNGNTLVVANITITNTTDSPQPFGTFDWLMDDASLPDYIRPLDPPSGANSMMMPTNFTLGPGDTATYDVVIEYPANAPNPYFQYIEVSSTGEVYTTFSIPIK